MAPLGNFVSLLSHFQRAPAYPPYMTITTELQAPCRIHADNMPYSVHSFGANRKLNVSCWTTSTMKDNKGRLNENEGSWTWLWVNTNGSFGEPDFLSYPGVGNADQGGKARGEGCWLHEDSVKEGADVDFTEALEWCGPAPHHQVTSNFFYSPFSVICLMLMFRFRLVLQRPVPTLLSSVVTALIWLMRRAKKSILLRNMVM